MMMRMALKERLRRLDDSVLPGNIWRWNMPYLPSWVRWLGNVGIVLVVAAIIFLDQPWTSVVVVVHLAIYFGLVAYYKRKASGAGPDGLPTKP